jgi:hypothetical protein
VWTVPAALVAGFGVASVVTILVDVAASGGGSSIGHPSAAVTIVGDIVFDLAFVAAALYFASRQSRPAPRDFGFRRVGLARGLRAIVFGAVAYYGLTAVYASLFRLHGKDKLPSDLGVTHSTAALIAASVFVCVIAPVAEEFFFRGFIFGLLRSWLAPRAWGPWVAAIMTGILFGLAHAGGAAAKYLVPLAFLGFLLCLLRWKTGSLYPGMALHSINNSLAFGIDELHWGAAKIVAMALVALLAIAAVTAPLGWREPEVAVDGADAGESSPLPPAVASARPPGG